MRTRHIFWRRKTARGVGVGGVLYVLAMLSDQSWTKFLQVFAQLWYDLGPDELLHWLFAVGVVVDIYLELNKRE